MQLPKSSLDIASSILSFFSKKHFKLKDFDYVNKYLTFSCMNDYKTRIPRW